VQLGLGLAVEFIALQQFDGLLVAPLGGHGVKSVASSMVWKLNDLKSKALPVRFSFRWMVSQ